MNITPYLTFNGRCEEAVDFYKRVLGAEVTMLMRFSDAPGGGPHEMPPEAKTKIMHVAMRIGASEIMASDGMCSGNAKFDGVALSVRVPDAAAAETMFAALAADGKVQQPLIETFFAPRFGIVADRFGVSWMVVVEHQTMPSA